MEIKLFDERVRITNHRNKNFIDVNQDYECTIVSTYHDTVHKVVIIEDLGYLYTITFPKEYNMEDVIPVSYLSGKIIYKNY